MHPKAAEDLDMRPVALAHLTKLHSRFQGSESMISEDGRKAQSFRVDNGFLNADSMGLGFRRSKDMKDLLPNAVAVWGSRVIGTDEGDGWLKVGANFLPFFVTGIPVISPEAKSTMSPWSSPRSDRPPEPGCASAGRSPPMTPLATHVPLAALPASGFFGGWAPGSLPQFSLLGQTAAPFDFQALRELVRLLRECQKKVSKGIRPSEELVMVERLKRSLMDDLAARPHSRAWHYLLQELVSTQDAIEGKYPAPQPRSLPMERSSPAQASWLPLASPATPGSLDLGLAFGGVGEMKFSDFSDDEKTPQPKESQDDLAGSLVGGILTEALRSGVSDADAAGAILEAAARPIQPKPRHRTATVSTNVRGHSGLSGFGESRRGSPLNSPLHSPVEDRCAQLELQMARVRQARRA